MTQSDQHSTNGVPRPGLSHDGRGAPAEGAPAGFTGVLRGLRPSFDPPNGSAGAHGADAGPHHDPAAPDVPTLDELIDAYQHRRSRYSAARRAYQSQNRVTISESYFARNIHAGAVLLRPAGLAGVFHRRRHIKVRYQGTDAAVVQPDFEAALWRARATERKAGLMLTGQARNVIVEMAYSVTVYLLGVLDAVDPERKGVSSSAEARIESALAQANCFLAELEEDAKQAARRVSLRWYLMGLPIGALAVVLLVVASDGLQSFGMPSAVLALCLSSGAIGAILSVMVRVTRGERLIVDSAHGTTVTVLAGAFRPVIGGVFGVAFYIIVAAGLVPVAVPDPEAAMLLFFSGIAFVAGFSERWAQDTIVQSVTKVSAPAVHDRVRSATHPG